MRGRPLVSGRRLLVLAAAFTSAVALGPAAGSAHATKVTFIGDSSAAGIEFSTRAKRLLARGHDMRRDLKVCRRLVAQSCVYNGRRPRTALQAIQHYGTDLGRVLVIDVGYNDSSATYAGQLNQIMSAALARGVKGVVWVNLKAVRTDYRRINRIINRAKSRWARLHVANWNRYSAGHAGWFANPSEGIHLTSAGAVGLVKLVRAYIPRAAQGPRADATAAMADFDSSGTAAPVGSQVDAVQQTDARTVLVANSPPVGSNLGGGGGGSVSPGGLLAFAGGAALMLFLIVVTVRRRSTA